MRKDVCDIKDCGLEAEMPLNDMEWIEQEMFEPKLDELGNIYFWGRVGIANKTFCPKHKRIAMNGIADMIKQRYLLKD